jgi:hypothetical protein
MLALFNSSYRMIQILIYTLNVLIIGIGQPQGLPLRAIYLYWATTRVAPTGYLFVGATLVVAPFIQKSEPSVCYAKI